MSKTVSGSNIQFLWDVAASVPLLLKEGSIAYVYGPGGLPLEQVNGSTVLWLHHDQLGSTRLITDGSGSNQASYAYDAYGNLTANTGSITNPFRYGGQYQDAESGSYYLRARYYDPATGQFLSRDPVVATTREPYSYVQDNPLNGGDPTGLCNINPFSGNSCVGAAADFVNHNAGTISAVSGLAAVALAPIPFVDVLSVPLAAVAIGTGALAARNDLAQHKYVSAALDIAGAIPGVGALGALRYAKFLGEAAEAAQAAGWGARDLAQLQEILGEANGLATRARYWRAASDLLAAYAAANGLAAIDPGNFDSLFTNASAAEGLPAC
jgi:RHS repeat-associated protein